jgi:ABC-type transport system substrate-binding protein
VSVSTWPEFDAKKKKKQAQMWGLAWGADYPDSENFLQLFYSPNSNEGSNESNYSNPAFDKLYEQALTMEDTPERTALYRQMAEMVIEDSPFCPDMHRTRHYAYHKRLKNFSPDEVMENYIKYWRIDMSETARRRKSRRRCARDGSVPPPARALLDSDAVRGDADHVPAVQHCRR